MRILHVTAGRCNPESANGADKTVYHLCRQMALDGHEVAIFSVTTKPALPVPGVDVRTYLPRRILGRQVDPRNLKLLNDLVLWKPDVVHLHSVHTPLNDWLGYCLRHRGISYAVTPHGGYGSSNNLFQRFVKRLYLGLFERRLLDGALFIHAVGDDESIRATKTHAPIIFIPNGINLKSSHTSTGDNKAVEPFSRMILYLGRLAVTHKGLDLLVEGFARSGVSADGWRLVLAGPGKPHDLQIVDNIIHQFHMEDTITRVGPLYGQEKWDLINKAGLFVHTSRWEGMPFAVLEAMSAGVCCVVTPSANPFRQLGGSDACLVCTESNPDAIAKDLAVICAMDPSRIREKGRLAAEQVARNFDWKKIAIRLVDIYKARLDG